MSSRLSLAYMIDSVPFSKLLYCCRSAMNTDAANIPVASARRELSFPWQCPADVARRSLCWVDITHPKVMAFDFPEPSLTMKMWYSV